MYKNDNNDNNINDNNHNNDNTNNNDNNNNNNNNDNKNNYNNANLELNYKIVNSRNKININYKRTYGSLHAISIVRIKVQTLNRIKIRLFNI